MVNPRLTAGTSSRYIDEKQNDDSDELYKTTCFEFSGKPGDRRVLNHVF